MAHGASLILNMDNGCGFVDRFLISIPKSLVATTGARDEARRQATLLRLPTVGQMYGKIFESVDRSRPIIFEFDDEAQA